MNPIQMLPRHQAQEVMLLQRRMQYLTAQCEHGDDAHLYAAHLEDVSSFKDFIDQLSTLQS